MLKKKIKNEGSDNISKKPKKGGFFATIRMVLYAILAALILRTVALEPFNIPSGSMIPNLMVGDYLFVSKYSYGYSKYSLPWSLPLWSGRILGGEPERGDVAVFKLPRDNETDYIKRIIGLPGDRIQVRNGVVYLNDRPLKRNKIKNFEYKDSNGHIRRLEQYRETLPNGVSYNILEATPYGALDDTPIYTVPIKHYFAMGDNRDNSLDSRVLSAVGYIPEENLVGRAEFTFYSTNGIADIWEVWKWGESTRFERVFKSID
ncbi:MAG: signal peptidase I [Rhodospirillaceae bacterium]|nr:signal peptidase I [Rhodospirillaceae bacterium]|tara:strand:- start:111 stop:893 length:783 start_codon:yes stop_codon:yes gene_type:complete